jgi:DNA-binding transcriptional LysR family regulator
MDMELPIDLLRTFSTVTETGSFTRAGESLFKTQSAISMQMKRLESVVGQPLFRKKGRTFELTPAGETLLEHAARILAAHNEAIAEFVNPGLRGRVRFGCAEDYASRFLPEVLSGFRTAYPSIRVDIKSAPDQELYQELRKEKLDLCLLEGMVDRGTLVHREPVVWVASRNGTAHAENPLPLAVYHDGCLYRKWAEQALRKAGRRYWIAFSSPSLSSILAAVKAGLAVAPIGGGLQDESLRILGPESGFPLLPVSEVTLHKSRSADDALVDCFADYVIQSFRRLVETAPVVVV